MWDMAQPGVSHWSVQNATSQLSACSSALEAEVISQAWDAPS